MANYLKEIRAYVGHHPIILTFAGGILLDDTGSVLLQRRSDFKAWGLPGGAMEYGETAAQTCQRELEEECWLSVAVTGLLGVESSQIQRYPNGDMAQCVTQFFAVKRLAGQLKSDHDETLELAYFPLNHLPPIFSPQHTFALSEFARHRIPFYQ